MSDTSTPAGLTGRRVAMLVWNAFVHDARVRREAETLLGAGALVQVTGILTDARPVALERIGQGIRVHRVSRRNRTLASMIMAPRLVCRRLAGLFGGDGAGPTEDPRWWQLDRLLARWFDELAVNWRLYRSAVAFQPDVVHAHDVNTLAPAWLAARRCRAKLIYDAHEISADREGYDGRVWLVRLVERRLGRAADGRITTTRARADWFRSTYGYPDMTVLQNRPVWIESVSSDRIRRTFGIAPDRPVVLYQGGLQWGRGLRNLLQAMRTLPQADLVFVGDGAQRASLEEAAADLRGRVHFAGQVSLMDLPDWTASADIGVQTLRNTCLNHYTTDSNKLFEYVMGGLPVVASDFPEIRAVVAEWDIGLLVEPESVEFLTAALRSLIDDPELRQRYAANAHRARDHLDWSSQAPALLALYQDLGQ